MGSDIHSKDVVERLERGTEAEAREIGSGGGGEVRRVGVRVRAMAMSRADLRFALHLNVGEQGRVSINETLLSTYTKMAQDAMQVSDFFLCYRLRFLMGDGISVTILPLSHRSNTVQ